MPTEVSGDGGDRVPSERTNPGTDGETAGPPPRAVPLNRAWTVPYCPHTSLLCPATMAAQDPAWPCPQPAEVAGPQLRTLGPGAAQGQT